MNENDFKETLRKYYGGWRKRLDEVLVSVEVMSKHFESPELADDVSAALTEVDRLKNVEAELDRHKAARYAYATEFSPNTDGDPDIGSVHENIRKLKQERDKLLKLLKEADPIEHCATSCDYCQTISDKIRELG